MDSFLIGILVILIVLLILSAFFSSSETSLMALNQIKLNAAEKKGHKGATRAVSYTHLTLPTTESV